MFEYRTRKFGLIIYDHPTVLVFTEEGRSDRRWPSSNLSLFTLSQWSVARVVMINIIYIKLISSAALSVPSLFIYFKCTSFDLVMHIKCFFLKFVSSKSLLSMNFYSASIIYFRVS